MGRVNDLERMGSMGGMNGLREMSGQGSMGVMNGLGGMSDQGNMGGMNGINGMRRINGKSSNFSNIQGNSPNYS